MMGKQDLNKLVSGFFQENPEALHLLEPQEDGHIFSKSLRETLEPFSKMDVRDCIKSADFMKALCKHAGMSDEEFQEILEAR